VSAPDVVQAPPFGYDSCMSDGSEHNGHSGRWPVTRLPQTLFDGTPPLVDAVSSLYDHVIDRVLAMPDRVTSAAEGRRLLAGDEGAEVMADQLQRVVVLAIPVLRTFARGARLSRIPWVLVATTAFSVASTVRAGVREAQVIGSLIAYRLEQASGRPADPALVKKLTVALYLEPRKTPNVADPTLPLGQVLRRWLIKGVIGRDTKKVASKALDAAERLDVQPYLPR
jgi:hypothetical protein